MFELIVIITVFSIIGFIATALTHLADNKYFKPLALLGVKYAMIRGKNSSYNENKTKVIWTTKSGRDYYNSYGGMIFLDKLDESCYEYL